MGPRNNNSSLRTVRDFIRWGEGRFKQAELFFGHGTDNARDEAAWLIAAVLQLPLDQADTWLDKEVSSAQKIAIDEILAKRISTRKPAAYLLNQAWFSGWRFYVDERVIVPRSHIAEFIQEQFQPWIKAERVQSALDLCTGSGCIAVALAHAFRDALVDASDISNDALAVARINVEAHKLQRRVSLMQSNLFDAMAGRRYDLIVTNPPYASGREIAALPAEYHFEPELALAAGEQGLDVIVPILAQAGAHLNPGGILVAEVGNSCGALQAQFPGVPFMWLTTSTGDESVFMLTGEQLTEYQPIFQAYLQWNRGGG
jgi:ribosomal protein L3 glutamine methyltransferase